MSLRSPTKAVKTALLEAKHPSQDFENLCDRFVAVCYGLAHSGYGSAKEHWDKIPDKHKHKLDAKPPVGGVPFWDTKTSGHTAICVSPGMIASNDIITTGEVSVVRIGKISESWSTATYLGWAEPFYHGATVSIPGGNKGTGGPPPGQRPSVSLSSVINAASVDPQAKQGHLTDKAGTLLIEQALEAEGLLEHKFVDGSFGKKTVKAYGEWQKQLHFSGVAANGIPGIKSLTALGAKHGFDVIA
jgi:hypothetical protein